MLACGETKDRIPAVNARQTTKSIRRFTTNKRASHLHMGGCSHVYFLGPQSPFAL